MSAMEMVAAVSSERQAFEAIAVKSYGFMGTLTRPALYSRTFLNFDYYSKRELLPLTVLNTFDLLFQP